MKNLISKNKKKLQSGNGFETSKIINPINDNIYVKN